MARSLVQTCFQPLPAGLLAAAATGALMLAAAQPPAAAWTAAVTVLCAIWWMSEALPLPATAMIPLAVFPLTGVLSAAQVADAYGNPMILLFLGGFLLSKAMEESGAHRRIALQLMHRLGTSARRLVFGFMAASALLSMWVSNTATALMLLPVALAVVEQARQPRLAIAVLLGVAYGASIGGLGTPIGSPPNLVFLRVLEESTGTSISFLAWMSLALPVVLLFLPIAGLWLVRGLPAGAVPALPTVGQWRPEEVRVLSIFALTALAWITRSDPFGGWSQMLGLPGASDADVALLAALLLFALPNGRGGRLLEWQAAARIPWGMLILFAGGIAIAKAFVSSGLSQTLGAQLAGLGDWPLLLLIAATCLAVTFLTELNSNTATAALLMPILAATALAIEIDPILLMAPAALSASCAFMLPVATPPNAIVFGSGHVPIRTMIREGLALNLIGVMLISGLFYLRYG